MPPSHSHLICRRPVSSSNQSISNRCEFLSKDQVSRSLQTLTTCTLYTTHHPGWTNIQIPFWPPTMPMVQEARRLLTATLAFKLGQSHQPLSCVTLEMALGFSANGQIGLDRPARNLYPK